MITHKRVMVDEQYLLRNGWIKEGGCFSHPKIQGSCSKAVAAALQRFWNAIALQQPPAESGGAR